MYTVQVVQKLIPQLPTLENLINIFVSNSQIEKAFLFDVVSKVRIIEYTLKSFFFIGSKILIWTLIRFLQNFANTLKHKTGL